MNERTKIYVILASSAAGIALLVWGAVYLHRVIDRNHAAEAQREHDAAVQYVVLPSVMAEDPAGKTAEIAFSPEDESQGGHSGEEDLRNAADRNEGDDKKPGSEAMNTPTPTAVPNGSASEKGSGSKSTESGSKKNEKSSGLENLYALNPDIAGWLRIAGTEIDYPFVAIGDKANKYLETSFDGKTKSKFGTIFTRNNVDDPGTIPNLVLYGHNMAATGYGMFTQLLKYKSSEFAEKHPALEIIVGDTTMTYEFFCCYNIKTTDSFLYEQMSFVGPKDLTRYSEEILSRSKVKAADAAAGAAHYVTLSTCDRKYDNAHGRFVVVFVRY